MYMHVCYNWRNLISLKASMQGSRNSSNKYQLPWWHFSKRKELVSILKYSEHVRVRDTHAQHHKAAGLFQYGHLWWPSQKSGSNKINSLHQRPDTLIHITYCVYSSWKLALLKPQAISKDILAISFEIFASARQLSQLAAVSVASHWCIS